MKKGIPSGEAKTGRSGYMGRVKKISVADLATLGNALCGIFAMVLLIAMDSPLIAGTSFILLGIILDGIDGSLARRYGTKHPYGRHLDSIADSITFCGAPAVMVLVVFLQPGDGLVGSLSYLNLSAVVCALLIFTLGISRLITFTKEGYKLTNFSGLATPAMTFLVIMVATAYHYRFSSDASAFMALGILSVASLLMVSNLEYPKIKGPSGLIFASGVCICVTVILLTRFTDLPTSIHDVRVTEVILFTALVAIAGYILFSPLFLRVARRREKGGLGKAI